MPTSRPVDSPTELGLPNCGDYPFLPKKRWKPGQGLQTDENNNPIDRNGGVWQEGANHNFLGEGREWDVQTGGGHINVGGDTGTAKYPVKRGRR